MYMALEELEKELYKKEESEELKKRTATSEERVGPPAGTLPGWRKKPEEAKARLGLEYQGPGVQTWRTWILWGSAGALVILAAVSGYFIYQAFTVKDIA